MNKFLASLEITFRRDPTNFRPRVNKLNSVKDREQKGKFSSYPSVATLLTSPSQRLATTSSLKNHPKVSAKGRLYTLLGVDLGPRGVG